MRMKTRKIRCYYSYAKAGNKFNNKVYYTIEEGWSKISLCTCLRCGELFAIDFENPNSVNLTIKDFGIGNFCPKCGSDLESTLEKYPEKFVTQSGEIGSYAPNRFIPPDSESEIIEIWELFPVENQLPH